jgi:hypothetical protein
MFDIRRLGTAAMFLILLAAGPARAAPEVGWWWNPNESGRGFFVESQNGIIYLAGYFYEPDGRATWVVAGGPNADPYNYQGRLLSYSNGQTLVGDYKPPSPPTDAGPVSISFSDDTHGTIVWPGGTIPIVRQVFGTGETEFESHNGWWWNDEESGRGYSVERQGDKLFIVGFMYDGAGKPVWYYSAGAMTSPTSYAGLWLQFSGGQTLLGPYQPPAAPVVAGQLSLNFTATNEAIIDIDDGQAATGSGYQKRATKRKLKPQFPVKGTPRPEKLSGDFVYDRTFKITVSGAEQLTTWSWEADSIALALVYDELQPLANPDRWDSYDFVSGGLTLVFEQVVVVPGATCTSPKQTFRLALDKDVVKLEANGRGQYRGTIEVKGVPFTHTQTCVAANGGIGTSSVNAKASFKMDLGAGTIVRRPETRARVLFGQQPMVVESFGTAGSDTTSGGWRFVEIK